MSAWIECVVVAPPNLQRPVRDRARSDPHAASPFARLLDLSEVVVVKIPSVDEWIAVRDTARSHDDTQQDLTGARHRLSKLLRLSAEATR